MATDFPSDPTFDAMQARIDLRKLQVTEALIDHQPFQAQIALDNMRLSQRHQQASKELKAKEYAARIRSVRQIHIDKDYYRLNFYNELYFDPARTVARGLNHADGCRILIECYRTFYSRLCDPAMISQREVEFLLSICGQHTELAIGTPESEIIIKLLRVSWMRFNSEEYEKLSDCITYYSEIMLKMLQGGNYPIPGNISSMLAKIHNYLMDEIRNHFKFDFKEFTEFNTNKHFSGKGRELFRELRRYFAKKIWELRKRARQFEQTETGVPLEITYSDADKKELLFYRNHLAQLEKQLKDSNTQLKSAGIIDPKFNKPSRSQAFAHEVNDNSQPRKAKPSEPPKITQSTENKESEPPKRDEPQKINGCKGFVQYGVLNPNTSIPGYRHLVPKWLDQIQQERLRKRQREAARKAVEDADMKVISDLKMVINGPTEDKAPQPHPGQNKDLKELQTWAVPHEPIKLKDFKPNPADLEHPDVKYESAEDWAELAAERKEYRERQVHYLRIFKNLGKAHNQKIRELKIKRPKKPENDEEQKE